MEGLIDTSVLVEYLLLEAEQHDRAKSSIEKLDQGFLPSVVVEELVHVLERLKLDKKTIREKVDEVLSSFDILSINMGNLADASEFIMKESGAKFEQFNDKLILSLAREEGMAILTFDRELMNECKVNGVEALPK